MLLVSTNTFILKSHFFKEISILYYYLFATHTVLLHLIHHSNV